jgi:flagellar basal-body rod protein FlgB
MYFSPSAILCPNSGRNRLGIRTTGATDSSYRFKRPIANAMDTSLSGLNVLTQVLDTAALRHRVIAQNVANVNTPGYRRLAVEFEDDLAKALTSAGNPAQVKPRVVIEDGPERVDGNTVDIDREMVAMNKNSLLYQAAAQIITNRIAQLRAAIAGR